jgi:hypothetical protein
VETTGDEFIPMDSIACLRLLICSDNVESSSSVSDKELSLFITSSIFLDAGRPESTMTLCDVAVRKFRAARKLQQRGTSAGQGTPSNVVMFKKKG